jgi:glutamyl-tRNA reductase
LPKVSTVDHASPDAAARAPDPGEVDRIFVVGATFRDLGTERREELAGELASVDRLDERVLLHTCHRVELIGVGDPKATLPHDSRVIRGPDAVERVLSVTAGFDSAVVAEEQVLGQVREAYQTALARRQTGPILNELLRRAIRFGKRVRTEAQPGGERSLADRAAAWVLERRVPADGGTALVVGSGEMGRLLAQRFAAAGLHVTVASRSLPHAERLVTELTGNEHRAAVIDAVLAEVRDDVVIAIATRGATELLDVAHLATHREFPLVVDLSSPGAVTPALAGRLGERLLNLDRIGGLEGGATVLLPAAEHRLRAELIVERDRFVAWLIERQARGAVGLLRSRAAELQARHLDRLRRRTRLDEDQLAAVDAMLSALLAQLLHEPILQLRDGVPDAAAAREFRGLDR